MVVSGRICCKGSVNLQQENSQMQRVSIMSMSNEELVESIHKDFMADECRQRLCEKNTAFLYWEIRRYCGNLSKEETEEIGRAHV